MRSIAEVSVSDVRRLWQEAERGIAAATHLEGAAQGLVRHVYEAFPESVALARAFVTVPLDALPERHAVFAADLARQAGVAGALRPSTQVLSLVGSYGTEPAWRDRRLSLGHMGIPLTTADFVDSIPMVSRLLRELGMDLAWVGLQDTRIIGQVLGSTTGVFYVEEASSETDRLGRKVIAAQDFVASHGIRSVFGFGGAYFGGAIVVFIVFCSVPVPRAVAQRMAPLANLFKASTVGVAGPSTIFV